LEKPASGYPNTNPRAFPASILADSPPGAFGLADLGIGWQGRGIFAISPACRWRRRIAHSQRTLPNRNFTKQKEIEVSMSTDAGRQNEIKLALGELISVLLDGQKGFAEIGDHLKDETLKRYFLAESLKRASFRGDLEEVLHQNGVHDIKESGTTIGTLQRAWGDLKAKLGGGDHTLLETAEQGEDAAKKAYADVLDQDLPLPVRQLIAEQQAHVLTAHDFVRSHRDALAAK
jgi:uncharacterized protein (TIGR02284 family)